MNYTDNEKTVLALMNRTNFKAISKDEVISIASKIGELRPEVAKDLLAQFPEFAGLIKNVMSDYKDELSKVIESDDASLKQVFDIAEKELDGIKESRGEFYDFADKVRSDLSKCLDNPELSEEERSEVLDREMEIFRAVERKDTEMREKEMEIADMVDRKDTEKREFNWGIVKAASYVAIIGVGIGASLLGGNIDFKLPKPKI